MSKVIFQTEVIDLGEQVDAFLKKECLCCSERMYRIR